VSERGQNIPTMATVGEPEIAPERMPARKPPFAKAPANVEAAAPPDPEIEQKLEEWKDRQTPWSNNE
jgi:hypothetical protein